MIIQHSSNKIPHRTGNVGSPLSKLLFLDVDFKKNTFFACSPQGRGQERGKSPTYPQFSTHILSNANSFTFFRKALDEGTEPSFPTFFAKSFFFSVLGLNLACCIPDKCPISEHDLNPCFHFYFNKSSHYIPQDGLELTLWPRLALSVDPLVSASQVVNLQT